MLDQVRTYKRPRRPGRPAVPMDGRGHRPYDPRWGTPKRWAIIFALHRYRQELDSGELTHCDLAEYLGTSISYLSITKNSVWGQRIRRQLAVVDGTGAAYPEGEKE